MKIVRLKKDMDERRRSGRLVMLPDKDADNMISDGHADFHSEVSNVNIPPSSGSLECIHRGPFVGTENCDQCGPNRGQSFQTFACVMHASCSFHKMHSKVKSCAGCLDRDDGSGPMRMQPDITGVLPPMTKATKEAPQVDLLKTSDGKPVPFQDLYHRQSVILVGGGPSLKKLDLQKLYQPGITIAAMNNAAVVVRPHIWLSVDIPTHFSEWIWKDPAILKICKDEHGGRILNEWDAKTQKMIQSKNKARDAANVVWFFRDKVFQPSTFLTQPKAAWRNEDWTLPEWVATEEKYKWSTSGTATRCVMLPAIRILFWLGFRRIFLLGTDFKMSPEEPYAFPESVDETYRLQNELKYSWANKIFKQLVPHFDAYGLQVINCTEGSNLTAFQRATYDQALDACTAVMPDRPRTLGLYKAGGKIS